MAVAVHNGLVEHFNNLISAPDALGEEIEIFVNIVFYKKTNAWTWVSRRPV